MPCTKILPRILLPLLLLAVIADAGPVDKSIGVCTRKDEFAKRQEALDPVVAALGTEEKESKRKKIVKQLVKASEKDIECLIRYREPCLVPVFAEVSAKGKKWFNRSRALYALKMLGDPAGVPAAIAALGDKHPLVRDAAAGALGHLRGPEAVDALTARRETEKDPYVRAVLESAIVQAGQETRFYEGFPKGTVWKEDLVGPEGAKRVAFAWTVKGQKLFNDYDARTLEVPEATSFFYPIDLYDEDLFAGYPRNSFGAGGTHAGEDCAWFREGTSLFAITDGVVRMVQGAGGDWGFLVAIEHRLPGDRYLTSTYGHMGFDLQVKAGDVVRAGQRIGTVGLSCAVENGGYGAHVHFGLGNGPFRRPAGLAIGDQVDLELEEGGKVKVPVVRLTYSKEGKNRFGFPLTAMVVERPDHSEQIVEISEQPTGQEIAWFQAYVKGCRGWLNPQVMLPKLVKGE
jgi:murein DD-endopeptidase MepM/ murein hydrolase activator NlpD